MARSPFPILAIGDTHCPCMLAGYPDFLLQTYEAYECRRVVHIGDLVDLCSANYHENDADYDNPATELDKALVQVRELTSRFRKVDLMLGNHDALITRKAQTAGLSQRMIKSFSELYKLPKGWRVHPRYAKLNIGNVQFQHGDAGKGGINAALKNATAEFKSIVQGHYHAQAFVSYYANQSKLIFGCQTGCGTDYKHMQQSYGIKFTAKPITSCAVIHSNTHAEIVPFSL